MRIIGGSKRGKTLLASKSAATRPMTDYVREAVFDILGPINGLEVLDCYAGSAAVGLEALSRGAAKVDAIERSPVAARLITKNLKHLDFGSQYHLFRMPIEKWLENIQDSRPTYDLVFADPPFDKLDTKVITEVAGSVKKGGLLVLKHTRRADAPALERLKLLRSRRYGDSVVSFYRR